MPEEDIHLGDIVVWNNIHWLVTKMDFDDTLCYTGVMQQCNRLLFWQNKKTHEIISQWCIVEKPYYSNMKEGKNVTVLTGEYKITIPYNDETKLVGVDKRFLIGEVDGLPQAFILTFRDEITGRYEDLDDSRSGFLIWNVHQDQYDYDRDNAELMIADYIGFDVLGSDNELYDSTNIDCIITGHKTIKSGIGYRVYKASLDTDVDFDVEYEWSIESEDPDVANAVHYTVDGDEITVKVDQSNKVLGKTFDIILRTNQPDISSDIFTVEVIGRYE